MRRPRTLGSAVIFALLTVGKSLPLYGLGLVLVCLAGCQQDDGGEAKELAHVAVGDVTVAFHELAPGRIVVTETGQRGANRVLDPTLVNRPVTEIWSVLAPGVAVPKALADAQARAPQSSAQRSVTPSSTRRPTADVGAKDSAIVGGPELALSESGTATWFQQNFCSYSYVDFQWCELNAWNWAVADSIGTWVHRAQGYVYVDLGSQLRFRTYIDDETLTGSGLVFSRDVLNGWWWGYWWHDGHTLWWDDTSEVAYRIDDADGDRFHFSGWMVDDDRFICGPNC